MNIEKQVCTLQQANRLKELGILQWAWLSFFEDGGNYFIGGTVTEEKFGKPIASAYSVAELGVMLDQAGMTTNSEGDLVESNPFASIPEEGLGLYDTEAEARAALLIWFLETGNVSVEDCNEKLLK